MRYLYLLCLTLILSASGIAQEANYVMTKPLNISKSGWNRVLLMKNGNNAFPSALDDQENTLAVLVRSKSEKSEDIKLAWVKLED